MTAELGTGGPGSRFTRTGLVADKNGTATAIDRGEVRVVVLSEVLLYREGLATLLGQVSGLQVTELVRDPGEAAAVVREGDADVVVVDLAAGDIGSVQTLLAAAPEARVVVLSAPQRPADVIALAEAGVLGYVTHEQSIAELAATIEKVAADEMVCAPWIATLLVRRVQALAADRPEAGILELVAEGLSNREIAARLHIELTTVKNHVHNILEKLGARTRAEAVGLMGFLSAFFSFFSGGSV